MGRFGYYGRLSKKQKRIYRESDEYEAIDLDTPEELRPIALSVGAALRAEDRVHVERLSHRLSHDLCTQLNVEPPAIRVHAARPSNDYGELHGLYTWVEGKRPRVEVWMRTAALEKVVAHRTYLRTLMHELCHHLDYFLLDLDDSFHTQGFFQRESSLMRQILPKPTKEAREAAKRRAAQLELKL